MSLPYGSGIQNSRPNNFLNNSKESLDKDESMRITKMQPHNDPYTK